jgi:hypothetical protein
MDEVAIHPNGYFESSLAFYAGNEDKNDSKRKPIGNKNPNSVTKSPIKGPDSMIN